MWGQECSMQSCVPYVCCVIGCCSRREKDDCLTFHKMPTIIEGQRTKENTSRRHVAWQGKINRKNWLPSENGYRIFITNQRAFSDTIICVE